MDTVHSMQYTYHVTKLNQSSNWIVSQKYLNSKCAQGYNTNFLDISKWEAIQSRYQKHIGKPIKKNGEWPKNRNETDVHKQAKMESQRNVAYSKN